MSRDSNHAWMEKFLQILNKSLQKLLNTNLDRSSIFELYKVFGSSSFCFLHLSRVWNITRSILQVLCYICRSKSQKRGKYTISQLKMGQHYNLISLTPDPPKEIHRIIRKMYADYMLIPKTLNYSYLCLKHLFYHQDLLKCCKSSIFSLSI